ncbi:MAG: tRNA epoxyqueuosine(34) reductase QueG [Myxococcota bacterium]
MGTLTASLKARARELGFAAVGVARAERLTPEGEQLRQFIAAGYHGQMDWLARTAEVRADPTSPGMVDGAVSVLVVAMAYARKRPGPVGPSPGRVARYAWGRDYHNVMRRQLRKLEAQLREEGFEARWSVDARPVLERAWAQRAGIGFVGKNCCLIVPGVGSHVFLGTVVTTAPLEPDAPMKSRCGSCTLCLDRCPTDAFVDAYQMDARRCISYLTIEHEGEIDEDLEPAMGNWVFGCDECQDVCPYNRTSPPVAPPEDPYAPDPRFETDAATLLPMDEDTYREWATGSPLRRPGSARMARNLAIALGNTGDKRHLPVLERAARHADPVVQKTAERALARVVRSPEPVS